MTTSAQQVKDNEYTILVRSGWQTVNIGDIAHTPGLLRIIERYLPGAGVVLWPNRLDRGVDRMLRKRFPRLRIVRDAPSWPNPDPRDDDPTIDQAIRESDVMVSGSGASLGSKHELKRWFAETGRPYGAFGITIGSPIGLGVTTTEQFSKSDIEIADAASFIFTRESKSLYAVRQQGLRCPHVEFVPDATFALDLRDDPAAERLLATHQLNPGEFLCAIPRLRFTPYWEIYPTRQIDPAEIAAKKAVNDEFAEQDHAKLREVIVSWVRQTGLKVLLCPEMTYQVGIAKSLVYDLLPEDVKAYVVHLNRYWLTDEAASVYRLARAVVSMECHSPIIAIANGRPGLYLRQPTDTWKGQMYADIGLGDWKFDLEAVSASEIVETILKIHNDYGTALERVAQAGALAEQRFEYAAGVIQAVVLRSQPTRRFRP